MKSLLLSLATSTLAAALAADEPHQARHRTIELNIGESIAVELRDGTKATVKLVDVRELRDTVRSAIREAQVTVEVNGIRSRLVYRPSIIAVARPHHLIWAGETVLLDAARSWSEAGPIARFEWVFTDGTTATSRQVKRTYDKPGEFSEVLKVSDGKENIGYDFAVVLVIDKATAGTYSPTIHAAYAPTQRIHANDAVTFKVRTFFGAPAGETWDFGDGTPPVKVRSDANAHPHAPDGYAETVHRFAKAGNYLVRVEAPGHKGATITSRLHVQVEEKSANR
jgi:hypothetical protein